MSPGGIRLYGLARRVISKNMNGEDAHIASMTLALEKGREERRRLIIRDVFKPLN
ncbi:hypothetical protein F2Q69_00003898 [Brassica cretica]|uniref:Uncharacterized protein n=1 Tax=Brassica cretica TaxID=69181 RepID=A0A8S9P0P4_BRACR|nr:hypothetical protein F2Q69_00003898 [Brassica cretica]